MGFSQLKEDECIFYHGGIYAVYLTPEINGGAATVKSIPVGIETQQIM